MSSHRFALPYAVGIILVASLNAVHAAFIQGRVYDGNVGDETQPIQGVTVTLYCSNNQGDMGAQQDSTSTDVTGFYQLRAPTSFEYYNIVETDPSNYTSVGATSVDGTIINNNQIQYSVAAKPLDQQTLTGNKFWDKSDTPPPQNHPPVANAGPDQTTGMGNLVELNGSGSSDLDGDPLTYLWSWMSIPAGSSAALDNPTAVRPKFIADLPGTYVAQLVVNDGKVDSSPDTTVVTATSEPARTGEIRGHKFDDANGDAIWNGTESGLAGWTIFADMDPWNAQLDPGEPSDVTGPDGSYSLTGLAPGIYNVYEVAQSGWQETCPASGFYGISVQANDLWDHQDFGNHREGMPPEGQVDTFDVCLNLEITFPDGSVHRLSLSGPATESIHIGPNGQTADTNGNGRDDASTELTDLQLTGLDPVVGQVKVGLNSAMPSVGQIEERINNTPGIIDVPPYAAAGSADSFFDVFFEIQFPGMGTILQTTQAKRLAGVIDHLPPGSNVYSEIAPKTIDLFDQNGQPTGLRLGPLTSCEAGYRRDYGDAPAPYPDASHVPGQVWLGFTAPDAEASTQASPPGEGDDTHVIDDEDGAWFMSDVVPGQFTWLALALSGLNQDLTYAVWIDYDGNGQWEHPAELYSSGSAVNLAASPLGLVIANPVPAGARIGTTYMRVRVYPGKDVTVSPSGDAQGGEVEDYQVQIKRTGQVQPPGHVIAGIKFNDLDGDGMWEPLDDEQRLPNWVIWLDTNQDGQPDQTTTTDANGGFEFAPVPPGTYTIGEQQQPGWTQTSPGGAGTFTTTVPNTAFPTLTFMMFGNTRGSGPTGEYDFGDALDTYGTLHSSGGPYHDVGQVRMGSLVDPEPDGQPGPQADLDDNTSMDDEDGVALIIPMTVGGIASIRVDITAPIGVPAAVTGWVDFDHSGTFEDPAERIASGIYTGAGTTVPWTETFQVPATAKGGETCMRFRIFRTEPGVDVLPSPTGYGGEGEVEDYKVYILSGGPSPDDELDYGDAPAQYPMASHNLGGPWLGSQTPDAETGTQSIPPGLGDDVTGTDDEDGAQFLTDLVPGQPFAVSWKARMNGPALMVGWIDLNHDGDWDDPGEFLGGIGCQGCTGMMMTISKPVPAGVTPGKTYARFRVFSGMGGGGLMAPSGCGGPGEVEDYEVEIKLEGTVLPPGEIVGGIKFNDLNGNGTFDSGEQGLANWTVWIDLNGNGVKDAGEATLTNPDGTFYFMALSPGTYTVHEDMQPGWTQTCPGGAGTQTITVQTGKPTPSILFGNISYVTGEGERPYLKWSQPPIEIDPSLDPASPRTFCAWNEPARSTHQTGATRQWQMVTDDFHCLGPIPITRIRWWGSYKAWQQTEPPALQPMAWHIGFWANQVAGLGQEELYPQRMVWSLEITADRVRMEPVGADRFPQQPTETSFAYDLTLNPHEWFHQAEFQTQGGIFWISITAIYPPDATQMNMWGWQTRPQPWRHGARQVAIMGDWPTLDMPDLFPGRIYPVTNSLICEKEQAYDLAFELLTEAPWVKWDQPFTHLRDWPYTTDRSSMAIEDEKGQIQVLNRVADDWICRRPEEPVIALAWYGSYIGFGYEACCCGQAPGPRRPDSFLISIWTDAPADDNLVYARPGQKVWEYKTTTFDEVMIGYDSTLPEGLNEPVFRYTVRLPEPQWFWQEKAYQVFWLSIVAVYKDPVDRIANPWGWTDRPHDSGGIATAIEYEPGAETRWRILRDPLDRGVDLCFTLYTRPPGP